MFMPRSLRAWYTSVYRPSWFSEVTISCTRWWSLHLSGTISYMDSSKSLVENSSPLSSLALYASIHHRISLIRCLPNPRSMITRLKGLTSGSTTCTRSSIQNSSLLTRSARSITSLSRDDSPLGLKTWVR